MQTYTTRVSRAARLGVVLPLSLAALAALAAACSSNSGSAANDTASAALAATKPATDSTGAAIVTIATDEEHGMHLTDGSGRSIYLFEKDSAGKSACDSACAVAWPPFTTTGNPTVGGVGVNAGMLSTITRTDGKTQVVYNGHPLYYFAQDKEPGDAKGQDVDAFGADWYLVHPSGAKQEGKEADDDES